jgi:hypothetical protein
MNINSYDTKNRPCSKKAPSYVPPINNGGGGGSGGGGSGGGGSGGGGSGGGGTIPAAFELMIRYLTYTYDPNIGDTGQYFNELYDYINPNLTNVHKGYDGFPLHKPLDTTVPPTLDYLTELNNQNKYLTDPSTPSFSDKDDLIRVPDTVNNDLYQYTGQEMGIKYPFIVRTKDRYYCIGGFLADGTPSEILASPGIFDLSDYQSFTLTPYSLLPRDGGDMVMPISVFETRNRIYIIGITIVYDSGLSAWRISSQTTNLYFTDIDVTNSSLIGWTQDTVLAPQLSMSDTQLVSGLTNRPTTFTVGNHIYVISDIGLAYKAPIDNNGVLGDFTSHSTSAYPAQTTYRDGRVLVTTNKLEAYSGTGYVYLFNPIINDTPTIKILVSNVVNGIPSDFVDSGVFTNHIREGAGLVATGDMVAIIGGGLNNTLLPIEFFEIDPSGMLTGTSRETPIDISYKVHKIKYAGIAVRSFNQIHSNLGFCYIIGGIDPVTGAPNEASQGLLLDSTFKNITNDNTYYKDILESSYSTLATTAPTYTYLQNAKYGVINGYNQYFLPRMDFTGHNKSDTYTLSTWVCLTDLTPGKYHFIVGEYYALNTAGSSEYSWFLSINTTATGRVTIANVSTEFDNTLDLRDYMLPGYGNTEISNFLNIIIVIDKTNNIATCYLNGVLLGTVTLLLGSASYASPNAIQAGGFVAFSPDYAANVGINSIEYYASFPTPQEALAIYQKGPYISKYTV